MERCVLLINVEDKQLVLNKKVVNIPGGYKLAYKGGHAA